MASAKKLPDQETLTQLLSYDPSTGKLWWKSRGPEWFQGMAYDVDRMMRSWNSTYAGKEALIGVCAGYRAGRILGTAYKAHRVIWKMVYGEDPEEIDHINGNPGDNRIANLRSVSTAVNMRNKRRYKNNKRSISGVTYRKAQKSWRVRLHKNGKLLVDKTCATFKDAKDIRTATLERYDFTARHGL